MCYFLKDIGLLQPILISEPEASKLVGPPRLYFYFFLVSQPRLVKLLNMCRMFNPIGPGNGHLNVAHHLCKM